MSAVAPFLASMAFLLLVGLVSLVVRVLVTARREKRSPLRVWRSMRKAFSHLHDTDACTGDQYCRCMCGTCVHRPHMHRRVL